MRSVLGMFYCLCCHKLEESDGAYRVFSSGFYTLTNGKNYPLGLCQPYVEKGSRGVDQEPESVSQKNCVTVNLG